MPLYFLLLHCFISLDSENLYEDRTDYYDFDDNQFPYFKGNANKRLSEIIEDEEDDIDQDSNVTLTNVSKLTKYVPKNVLRCLNQQSYEVE